MWSHEIVDVLSGERVMALSVSSSSWQARLNGQIGSGSTVVETRAAEHALVTTAMWRSLREPWTRAVVGMWNGTPVWAHIISGAQYAPETGRLTLQHSEIGALLSKRLFFGAGAEYQPGRTHTFGPFTRQGMLIAWARHLVAGGAGTPPSGSNSPWRLPVWFNDESASGNWTHTARIHEFERPWQRMIELTEEDSGPDFCYGPGFFSEGDGPTVFQWVFHVSSQLSRSTHEYQVGADQSPVIDVQVSWDGSEQQTGVMVLGEGSGSARPVGTAVPVDSLVRPAMDTTVSMAQTKSVAALDSTAREFLKAHRQPAESWQFSLKADAVLAGMHGGDRDGLRPGSRVRLRFDDVVLGSGVREFYVTGVSGDMTDVVRVEAQTL